MSRDKHYRLMHTNCVICGVKMDPSYDDPEVTDGKIYADGLLWNNGGLIKMDFGYGSRLFDTNTFYGLIHDECAKALIETAASEFMAKGALGPAEIENTVDVSQIERDEYDGFHKDS